MDTERETHIVLMKVREEASDLTANTHEKRKANKDHEKGGKSIRNSCFLTSSEFLLRPSLCPHFLLFVEILLRRVESGCCHQAVISTDIWWRRKSVSRYQRLQAQTHTQKPSHSNNKQHSPSSRCSRMRSMRPRSKDRTTRASSCFGRENEARVC